jgi:hypothetical protein
MHRNLRHKAGAVLGLIDRSLATSPSPDRQARWTSAPPDGKRARSAYHIDGEWVVIYTEATQQVVGVTSP